jgi:DNA-binding response OmpR family regulator
MKILLVEDEIHKRDEMNQCVQEVYGFSPEIVDGVSSAVMKVMEADYDLIILDMALSTFGESTDDKKKGTTKLRVALRSCELLSWQKK